MTQLLDVGDWLQSAQETIIFFSGKSHLHASCAKSNPSITSAKFLLRQNTDPPPDGHEAAA